MTSPRPYVAAAAAAVLAALYFVPSATASPSHDTPASTAAHAAPAAPADNVVRVAHATGIKTVPAASQHIGLADTGSIDTKPYLFGGAAFLAAGAGLVVNASRRARQAL